jgi:hypothetical protein
MEKGPGDEVPKYYSRLKIIQQVLNFKKILLLLSLEQIKRTGL